MLYVQFQCDKILCQLLGEEDEVLEVVGEEE